MIWIARYNAVMSIIAVVGIIIFWAASGPMDAIAFLLFMLFLRFFFFVANILWTAVTGNPLFYDTKILNERRKQASDDSVIDDEDV
tara:strand:+ start:18545 stop:18802 length:258 start_codon:yes stop_codon:yes gene_type:complete